MKRNNKTVTTVLISIVSLLPLAALLLNTSTIRDIFTLDLYSGFSLRYSYIAIIFSYLIYIGYQQIYSTKNTRLFLQISITNFVANLLHTTLFVIGMLSLYSRYSTETLSSQSGVLIACTLLTLTIQTCIFDSELFTSKIKPGSKNIAYSVSAKVAPISTILNLILILSMVTLAYLSPELRSNALGCTAILLWNIFYIIVLRREVLPKVS